MRKKGMLSTSIHMMETTFKFQMEQAAISGDKKKFEQMQEQLQWLHEYKLNRYKN